MVLSVGFTPLVLVKIHRNSDALAYTSGEIDSVLLRAMDSGLLNSKMHAKPYRHEQFFLTAKGTEIARTATPSQVRGADAITSHDPSQNAYDALWFYLLLRGGYDDNDLYSSRDVFGNDLEVLHLLSCGLNTRVSPVPTDATWEEFAGTFVENDRISGLRGTATCLCGKVNRLTVSLPVSDGIASVFTDLMNPAGMLP